MFSFKGGSGCQQPSHELSVMLEWRRSSLSVTSLSAAILKISCSENKIQKQHKTYILSITIILGSHKTFNHDKIKIQHYFKLTMCKRT